MLSFGVNVKIVSSGGNVIIWCYHVLLPTGMITHPFFIFLDAMLSSGANGIILDEMLSSGMKCYHLELMLSSGANVIIWS